MTGAFNGRGFSQGRGERRFLRDGGFPLLFDEFLYDLRTPVYYFIVVRLPGA